MSADETGTMAHEPTRAVASRRLPGLVLVHAPGLSRAPAAIVLADETAVVLGREPPVGGITIDHTRDARRSGG